MSDEFRDICFVCETPVGIGSIVCKPCYNKLPDHIGGIFYSIIGLLRMQKRELRHALKDLYDEAETRRASAQERGLAHIDAARAAKCATTVHPSQWAPTPAMLAAESLLGEK